MAKISSQEKKILRAAQYRADMPVAELAKRIKMKSHVVHYTLNKLKEAEITRRGVIIDHSRLGLTLYRSYFSLSATGVKHKPALRRFVQNHPKVRWFGELGGNYQYGLSFLAYHGKEAGEFLEELSKICKDGVVHKEIFTINSISLYGKKYLAPAPKGLSARDVITLEHSESKIKIDIKDQQILAALSGDENRSHQEIAKRCGMARSTVEYRLKAMHENGLISAYVYYISATALGYSIFRLLIKRSGFSAAFAKRLRSFALEHPNITALNECLGNWDAEIAAEVQAAAEIIPLVEQLYIAFGDEIEAIEVLPVFKQSTSKKVYDAKWPLAN